MGAAAAEAVEPASSPALTPDRRRGLRGRLNAGVGRWLPPARLTWIAVIAIGVYGVSRLGEAMGLLSLLVLPPVAAATDLLFQRVRFPEARFPDAAIASGSFLAVLLPPTVIVAEAAVVVLSAIALKHILRSRGRPWFNPAALGVVLGAVLFGMAPAWWVAIGIPGEVVMLALGVLVTARSWRNWRLPVTFLIAFAALATLYHFLFRGAVSSSVLLLSVIDPTALFFALFMVPEPRGAPSEPAAQPLYAAVIAVLAVFSPLLFPSLGLLLGLLVGNGFSVLLRRRHARLAERAEGAEGRRVVGARRTGTARARSVAARWSAGRRVSAGLLVLVLLGVTAGASLGPSSTPSLVVSAPPATGGGSTTATACATDTTSVDSSTLSLLHAELGPSVILSYDRNTGVVIFYDPVNQVTVTETDLYEDHGFAEFNGDDFATSGCAP